jgi:hypothetical protein
MYNFLYMNENNRHNLIKKVQSELPRGAPFDLRALANLGVSPTLSAHYAKHNWLVRLAQGVYAFPNDNFSVFGAMNLLQQRIPMLHVGGKSALAMHGIRHNLTQRATLVLWGNTRHVLPNWFTERFPSRYVYANLFDWPNDLLPAQTLGTPAGQPDSVCASVAERATFEMLFDVGTKQSLEEARNLFDGLRPPRIKLLGQLLTCCNSVKTVRLFLTWARETDLVDVDQLLSQYPVRAGSDKRWMTKLSDGTLLSLKQHG